MATGEHSPTVSAVQFGLAVVIIATVTLAPPPHGFMLVMPLISSARPAVVVAREGAQIVAAGRVPGSIIIRGDRGRIFEAALADGSIVMSTDDTGCQNQDVTSLILERLSRGGARRRRQAADVLALWASTVALALIGWLLGTDDVWLAVGLTVLTNIVADLAVLKCAERRKRSHFIRHRRSVASGTLRVRVSGPSLADGHAYVLLRRPGRANRPV